MKIYVLMVVFLVSASQAMDNNNQWDQDMLDAVPLLQGTGTNGVLKIEEIKIIGSYIKTARNHVRHIERLHNSPPLLLIPASVSFDKLNRISSFVKTYGGIDAGRMDSQEPQYQFTEPTTDVSWIADEVAKRFNISTQVKSLFTPKIKLEYGGAGSDALYLTFINLDQQKEYMFTFKGNNIISLGEQPITTIPRFQ